MGSSGFSDATTGLRLDESMSEVESLRKHVHLLVEQNRELAMQLKVKDQEVKKLVNIVEGLKERGRTNELRFSVRGGETGSDELLFDLRQQSDLEKTTCHSLLPRLELDHAFSHHLREECSPFSSANRQGGGTRSISHPSPSSFSSNDSLGLQGLLSNTSNMGGNGLTSNIGGNGLTSDLRGKGLGTMPNSVLSSPSSLTSSSVAQPPPASFLPQGMSGLSVSGDSLDSPVMKRQILEQIRLQYPNFSALDLNRHLTHLRHIRGTLSTMSLPCVFALVTELIKKEGKYQ